jgi:hypothetical protein
VKRGPENPAEALGGGAAPRLLRRRGVRADAVLRTLAREHDRLLQCRRRQLNLAKHSDAAGRTMRHSTAKRDAALAILAEVV